MIKRRNHNGFTFIEVMVAMLLLVMAILVSVGIARGSVAAVKDTREMSTATWLLQQKIVEQETQLETLGIDKGCEKKKEGKFAAPYERYTWVSFCEEIDFNISESASKLAEAQAKGEDANAAENQIQKLILKTASDYITKSMRELHTEVTWTEGKNKRTIDVTTHFVRFDQPLALPGIPGGSTTSPTTTTPPSSSGGSATGG